MTPGDAPSPGGKGYTAALLARHLTLCLTRMRLAVSEMLDAGAGWGAFLAVTAVASVAIAIETALREHMATGEAGAFGLAGGDLIWLGVGMFALFGLIAILLAVFWWAAARLFGSKLTLLRSALGVAAGGLPQLAFSAGIIACALVLPWFTSPETSRFVLDVLDYLVILPLFAYGLVAYAAAAGFSLLFALVVQLVGAVMGSLLLFGLISVGGLYFDKSIGWLVQLVLG